MLKRYSPITIICFLSLLLHTAQAQTADNWKCVQDNNGDGYYDASGESASCLVASSGGLICPLGMSECVQKTVPSDPVCPAGTSLWTTLYMQPYVLGDRCASVPTCSAGYYVDTAGKCAYTVCIWTCRTYYYNFPPTCPSGTSLQPFVRPYYSGWQTYYLCAASPPCPTGAYDQNQHKCLTTAPECPHGTQYPCLDYSGAYRCSPNACTDIAAVPPDTTDPSYLSYTNNGTVGSDGSCTGIVLLFNGKGGECRPPGVDTAYRDCCDYGGGSTSWLNYCKEEEATVDRDRDAGKTHYIEEYCKTRWQFGFGSVCVQRARTYCVFNSKLGRIIQEQGRLQLQAFQPNGIWGDHSAPNCKGFSPQEFQMLDFSKIDLSEFYSDVSQTMSTAVQQNMQNSMQQFYDQTVNP